MNKNKEVDSEKNSRKKGNVTHVTLKLTCDNGAKHTTRLYMPASLAHEFNGKLFNWETMLTGTFEDFCNYQKDLEEFKKERDSV